jgi:penicillin-binding protein 1A/penicillin-binding protein 2A
VNQPAAKKSRQKFGKTKWVIFALFLVFCLQYAAWIAIGIAGNVLIDEKKLALYENPRQQGNGQTAATGTYIPVGEMPDYLRHAFIAIEDHRFDQHVGIDLISLTRAALVDVTEGSKAQGGSTITMQLARNMFLNGEKSFSRKLKEIAIAIQLERRYSKEQILEMYLNHIYFGHGKYGIEEAANWYFGKTARAGDPKKSTIGLSEAAMLAALPKAPEAYSPVKHPEKAKQRQRLVLARMAELGYITEAEQKAALQQEIVIVPVGRGYPRSS